MWTSNPSGNRFQFTLAVALVVILSGCATDRFSVPNPFGSNEASSLSDGQPSITEQVDRLESLQRRAGDMSPAEKSQLASSLAKSYLQETEPAVRLAMTKTFGYLATPAAVVGLEASLQDASPEVRIEAVQALGRLGSPEALQLLIATHNSDTNVDVRIAATRQLGRFDQNQSVLALGQSLDDADPAIQYVAMQSLKRATGANYGKDVRQWKQYVNNLPAPNNSLTPEADSPVGVAGRPVDFQ